jgi:hypothetical protein
MVLGSKLSILTCVLVLAGAPVALAQGPAATPQTAASPAALDALLAERVRVDESNRQVVRDVLDRSQVREVAAHAGLDLERARHAVGTLTGAELQEIADHARHVDASLAGGASTLVISTTAIIIILLVVILLVVAID